MTLFRSGLCLQTLAVAMLVGTGAAHAAPPDLGDAPPPALPAPPVAPRPKHRNEPMMIAGIVVTMLAVASVPIGAGLIIGNPTPPRPTGGFNPDGEGGFGGNWGPWFTDGQAAGLIALGVGAFILLPIGIPLWENGAKPPKPDTKAAVASWRFAPFTVPPWRGSPTPAPVAPAGVAVAGTF